eukprot:1159009-Pelagomonas_calceolata.AAC.4
MGLPLSQGLLEMMYQRIDEWVTEFIMDMQRIVPSLQCCALDALDKEIVQVGSAIALWLRHSTLIGSPGSMLPLMSAQACRGPAPGKFKPSRD